MPNFILLLLSPWVFLNCRRSVAPLLGALLLSTPSLRPCTPPKSPFPPSLPTPYIPSRVPCKAWWRFPHRPVASPAWGIRPEPYSLQLFLALPVEVVFMVGRLQTWVVGSRA